MKELGYLKVARLSHIRYHGVLLWNEIAVVVECGHVVWYIQLSWRENVDTWFSTSMVCGKNQVVSYTRFL